MGGEKSPEHHTTWAEAFARGLRVHGIDAVTEIRKPKEHADLLVLWTVRSAAIRRQLARGGHVCVLERGYMGDRFKWTSVSFGGALNGRARFHGVRDDPSRFEQYFSGLLQPWSTRREGPALLIGQVTGDASLRAVQGDLSKWYVQCRAKLEALGFEVKFRPHPRCRSSETARRNDVSLQRDFEQSQYVVTFNSNTGVESVLAGVPTYAEDRGSMAWPVVGRKLGHLTMPDRTAWANRLAWCQWQIHEMENGDCWAAIGLK